MRPELITAAELLRRNTPEAVEQAVDLLQHAVYSFSMKMCGHREDAEDTTQDVLIGSLKHLPRFQEPGALAAWLYTVTRNRCRHMRRPQGEPVRRALSLDELMPDAAERKFLLDNSPTPEAGLLRMEEHQILHSVVLRLPPSLRVVLVLHDMEELTTDDVAQILGLRPGTVRVRLHRARLMVRKEMSEHIRTNMEEAASLPLLAEPASQKRSNGSKSSMECRELFSQLSEYLDGRVEPLTCEQMRTHIEGCPTCVAFLKDLKSAIDRCRSLRVACDPTVAARMRELFTREYLRMIGSRPDVDPQPAEL